MALIFGCPNCFKETFQVNQFSPAPTITSPLIKPTPKDPKDPKDPVDNTSDKLKETESSVTTPNINVPTEKPTMIPLVDPVKKSHVVVEPPTTDTDTDTDHNHTTDHTTEHDNDHTLNSRERELFDQITQNKISSTDLEKLIKAGAVTEKMIEKFLSHLDKQTNTHVEPFCSGATNSCAAWS
jgi:hypothetical protein